MRKQFIRNHQKKNSRHDDGFVLRNSHSQKNNPAGHRGAARWGVWAWERLPKARCGRVLLRNTPATGMGHGNARPCAALARAPWEFPVQIPGWRARSESPRSSRVPRRWLVSGKAINPATRCDLELPRPRSFRLLLLPAAHGAWCDVMTRHAWYAIVMRTLIRAGLHGLAPGKYETKMPLLRRPVGHCTNKTKELPTRDEESSE